MPAHIHCTVIPNGVVSRKSSTGLDEEWLRAYPAGSDASGSSHRLFTPDIESERELHDGVYLRGDRLETVEPDLISGLRAAIREVDSKDQSRRPVSLLTHGITLFRKNADGFCQKRRAKLEATGRSRSDNPGVESG